MKIIPIGKRVLIKQEDPQETYGSTGIYIPDAQRVEECKGTVIAVGDEVECVKAGDVIQYADYITPLEIQHNGEEHLIIAQGDILVKLIDVH